MLSTHTYSPLSSFCSMLIIKELMLLENTRRGLADRGLPSFSQDLVLAVPAVAWQLRLAVLLPAMSVVLGPMILVPEMASVGIDGKNYYCYRHFSLYSYFFSTSM